MAQTYHVTHLGRFDREGGYNDRVDLYRCTRTGKRLVRKQFKERDCPGHARNEVNALRALRPCSQVYNLIDWEVRTRSGHLWLEHADKGTLKSLLEQHRDVNRGRVGQHPSSIEIPEPFIWHVFWSLVEALSYMQNGSAPIGFENPDWNWIYHRDIHPSNVFIKSVGDYLQVLLGDFGSSINRRHRDLFSQARHRQAYVSPNMAHLDFWLPRGENETTRKSDVFQVGLVIVSLCHLSLTPKRFFVEHAPHMPAGPRYSSALNTLLLHCLQSNPRNRISVVDLRSTLSRYRNAGYMDGRNVGLHFAPTVVYAQSRSR